MTVVRNRRFVETCRAFNIALRSQEAFNPFVWIYRLALALVLNVFDICGLPAIVRRHKLDKIWMPAIPMLAVGLVLLVTFAYFASLRFLIRKRWCCDMSEQIHTTCSEDICLWMYIHDTSVAYLACMIIFYYLKTTFTSPGVVLARQNGIHVPWKAINGQGGCIGYNPKIDVQAEHERVASFGNLRQKDTRMSKTFQTTLVENPEQHGRLVFPSPDPSFCSKCQIHRPPRCHHCSTCNRCVLNFDHHCVWLNNCIGYGNYRSFLLTLFFLMIACWYGVAMLFFPFYEPLLTQIKEHGLRWNYSNGTGILDLPPLMKLIPMLLKGRLPVEMIVDMVYPLMLAVGTTISVFLAYHLKYIILARTTFEHRVILEKLYLSVRSGEAKLLVRNPFDQGWRQNLVQIFGEKAWLIFIPVAIDPLPPCRPMVQE